MSQPKNEPRKFNPIPRAIFAGLVAGLVAGYVSYLFAGVPGFVIGFIVGVLIGSRTVIMVNKAREQEQ